MVIVQEEKIPTPKFDEESPCCAEIYDCSNFFIPAEIYISEEEIGW